MAKRRELVYELSIVKSEVLLGKPNEVHAHRIVLHMKGDVKSFEVAYPVEAIGNGGPYNTIEEMIEYLAGRTEVHGIKCIRNAETIKRQFKEIQEAMTEEHVQAVRQFNNHKGEN